MKLYHGSNTLGIQTLEPRLADHDRPYIYLTVNPVVAALYLSNAVERPYYWFPYGYRKDGVVEYTELYPNALQEAASGKSGCIYTVEADEKSILPFPNNPNAKLGTAPIPVKESLYIPDCYDWLMQQKQQGNFAVNRFEDKPERVLNWWYDTIQNYITEKKMIETPECSYARFVREKFPWIWEKYEKQVTI